MFLVATVSNKKRNLQTDRPAVLARVMGTVCSCRPEPPRVLRFMVWMPGICTALTETPAAAAAPWACPSCGRVCTGANVICGPVGFWIWMVCQLTWPLGPTVCSRMEPVLGMIWRFWSPSWLIVGAVKTGPPAVATVPAWIGWRVAPPWMTCWGWMRICCCGCPSLFSGCIGTPKCDEFCWNVPVITPLLFCVWVSP